MLPDIDLSKKVTDEADFSGKGVAGGVAKGVVGGTSPVNTDQPYFEFQVEKQVQQIPGTGNLRYPDMLRSANVEGEVLAQFTVGKDGAVTDASTAEFLGNYMKELHVFIERVLTVLPRED